MANPKSVVRMTCKDMACRARCVEDAMLFRSFRSLGRGVPCPYKPYERRFSDSP